MKSWNPQSKNFSRIPSMALAVRAIMAGAFPFSPHCRRMIIAASMPSIMGIMWSIKIMS